MVLVGDIQFTLELGGYLAEEYEFLLPVNGCGEVVIADECVEVSS